MKKKMKVFLSCLLTMAMLFGMVMPVYGAAADISGDGNGQPYTITSTLVAAKRVKNLPNAYLSHKNSECSASYFVVSGNAGETASLEIDTTKTKLYVAGGENVDLNITPAESGKTLLADAEIAGGSLSLYNASTGTGYYYLVTGIDKVGSVYPNNVLSSHEENAVYVTGRFNKLEGKVYLTGSAVIQDSTSSIISGSSIDTDGDNLQLTVKGGNVSLRGSFEKLTVEGSGNIIIAEDTKVSTLYYNAGSITVKKGVDFTFGGCTINPVEDTTLLKDRDADNSAAYYVPADKKYNVLSGPWSLGGDGITVKNADSLTADMKGNLLTVESGSFTAYNGTVAGKSTDAVLTVMAVSGAAVTKSGYVNDTKVYGTFGNINFAEKSGSVTTGYSIIVPKGQKLELLDPLASGKTHGFTAAENIELSEIASSLPGDFEYKDIFGWWKIGEETLTNHGGSAGNMSKNGKISGTFDVLSGSAILAGDTIISSGAFEIEGSKDYTLTINGGTGVVYGEFKKLTVNGGNVTDTSNCPLTISGIKGTAIEINGGTLVLENKPCISASDGGSENPAVKVAGGTLTIENGTVAADGDKMHAVHVADGACFYLGDPDEKDYKDNKPQSSGLLPVVSCRGENSSCVYVNNNGTANIYRGDLHFAGKESHGICVNNLGHAYVYPNNKYGDINWDITEPLVYIHGEAGALAAMYVEYGGIFEVRGRGALFEQPYNEDGSGYALYIHPGANLGTNPLAGGTYNGKVYYSKPSENERNSLYARFPENFYLRYDGKTANYGITDGTYGILPVGSYTDEFEYGSFVKSVIRDETSNEFNKTFYDSFGKRGEYYTVTDAEWELRHAMEVGTDYQLPAGISDGENHVVNVLTLDVHDAIFDWAVKQQGDVDVLCKTDPTTLYLAGRKITYDGHQDGSHTYGYKDGLTDTLSTIRVADGAVLEIRDAVWGCVGTNPTVDKYIGGFIGTGKVEYTSTSAVDAAAVRVAGSLNMYSGKLSGKFSGLYTEAGSTAVIGFSGEDTDYQLIKLNGNHSGLYVSGGSVELNGAEVAAYGDNTVPYGAVVAGGDLTVNGGLIVGSASTDKGAGILATGGNTEINGGCIYGKYVDKAADYTSTDSCQTGISLVVNGGEVHLDIDDAHKNYIESCVYATSGKHHINNIDVMSGHFYSESSNNRNNGTLICEGGETTYLYGVTYKDTTVYAATTGDVFSTKFFVYGGDFGALNVAGNNNAGYQVLSNASDTDDAFENSFQLHGGYFASVDMSKITLAGISIGELAGTWSDKVSDGDWLRYNHYIEVVPSARNARGEWTEVASNQSGTAFTRTDVKKYAPAGNALAVRCAVDDFEEWLSGASETRAYTLYVNLWLGEDALCSNTLCTAMHPGYAYANGTKLLNTNKYGIYADSTKTALTVNSGAKLTISGSSIASDTSADVVQNLKQGAIETKGKLLLSNIYVKSAATALEVNGGETNLEAGSKCTGLTAAQLNSGKLTTKEGSVLAGLSTEANSAGLVQNGGSVSIKGGSFTGKLYGYNRNGADASNLNFIESGLFSNIYARSNQEALEKLLASGKTFVDSANIQAGLDILKGGSIYNGMPSCDTVPGGNSIANALDGTITLKTNTDKLTSNFTVSDRTIREVTLDADAHVTLSAVVIGNAVSDAAIDAVNNRVVTIYMPVSGSSITVTSAPFHNYITACNNAAELDGKIKPVTYAVPSGDKYIDVNTSAYTYKMHKNSNKASITGPDELTPGIANEYMISIDAGCSLQNGIKLEKTGTENQWITVAVSEAEYTNLSSGSSISVTVTPDPFTDYRLSALAVAVDKYGANGGGGGGGSSAYNVVTSSGDHGSITTDADRTYAGNTVTIAVVPEEGYTLETITVKDAKGNIISLCSTGDNTYSFTMPYSEVSIETTYMEDNTMLNFFTDVAASDYFYDPVLWAAEKGITNGMDNIHFAPNYVCSRAQIVTFLWRAAGSPEPAGNASVFTDIAGGSYYEKAVVWAVENGITNGMTADGFWPDYTVTRAQVVTFLSRLAKAAKTEGTGKFTDVPQGEYYEDAVNWAVANGITTGMSSTSFAPDAACIRAQIVTFLYRYFAK